MEAMENLLYILYDTVDSRIFSSVMSSIFLVLIEDAGGGEWGVGLT